MSSHGPTWERSVSVRQTSTPPPAYSSVPPIPLIHPEVFRPRAPRGNKELGIKDESQEQSHNLLDVPVHRSKSISPPPKYDVQHQATCFFLNLFSFRASKLYGIPVLDFLPDMLEKCGHHTAIYHASKAVSRMTLADRYSGQDARLRTSDDYAMALKSVAETMSNESEAVTDEAVTAVWLLGLYEVGPQILRHSSS